MIVYDDYDRGRMKASEILDYFIFLRRTNIFYLIHTNTTEKDIAYNKICQ